MLIVPRKPNTAAHKDGGAARQINHSDSNGDQMRRHFKIMTGSQLQERTQRVIQNACYCQ